MDKNTFKKNLNREIQKTKDQIESYLDMSQPVSPDNAIGRVSRMDAINNKSVTESALRNAQDKLSKLKRALDNVDNPDLGYASSVNKPFRKDES